MVHVHRNESTLCADVWHTGAPDSSTDTLNKRYTSTPINSRSHACKHISYTYTRLATRNPHTHQHTPIRKCSAIGVTVVLLRFHSLFSQIFIYCLEVGTCSSPFSQKKNEKKIIQKEKKRIVFIQFFCIERYFCLIWYAFEFRKSIPFNCSCSVCCVLENVHVFLSLYILQLRFANVVIFSICRKHFYCVLK